MLPSEGQQVCGCGGRVPASGPTPCLPRELARLLGFLLLLGAASRQTLTPRTSPRCAD